MSKLSTAAGSGNCDKMWMKRTTPLPPASPPSPNTLHSSLHLLNKALKGFTVVIPDDGRSPGALPFGFEEEEGQVSSGGAQADAALFPWWGLEIEDEEGGSASLVSC